MATSTNSGSLEDRLLQETAAQFFEMVPIRRMKWGSHTIDGRKIGPEIQRKVLRATVCSPLCKTYPPSLSYQRTFMKQFLHKLEDCNAEICDEVYETYTDLLSQQEEEDDMLCYKTYCMPSGATVSLQESVHLVTQGSTGFSTWQGGQYLAEWAMENSKVFEDKDVLELGSGLGLTGIVVCKHCQPKQYYFTDCHPQVLYLLSKNLELSFIKNNNDLQTMEDLHIASSDSNLKDEKIMRKIRKQLSVSAENPSNDTTDIIEICISPSTPPDSEGETVCGKELINGLMDFELQSKSWRKDAQGFARTLKKCEKINIAKLDWEAFDENLLTYVQPEVILAADVVYDIALIPALTSVLKKMLTVTLEGNRKPVAYIASAIRNEDSRDHFLLALGLGDLRFEEVMPPQINLFHYDRAVPIELLKISAA